MATLTHDLITTGFDFQGYRITRYLGLVRGITVRSRSIVGSLGGALQTIVGGNITLFTELCEQSRKEAYDLMVAHAPSKIVQWTRNQSRFWMVRTRMRWEPTR
ncbi:MAG: YbjQ family protein [Chloroflexi bacterium]|nr:MAG: YbjQ family protein [Chloroflexota bacterium]